jgi:hypothetical protein
MDRPNLNLHLHASPDFFVDPRSNQTLLNILKWLDQGSVLLDWSFRTTLTKYREHDSHVIVMLLLLGEPNTFIWVYRRTTIFNNVYPSCVFVWLRRLLIWFSWSFKLDNVNRLSFSPWLVNNDFSLYKFSFELTVSFSFIHFVCMVLTFPRWSFIKIYICHLLGITWMFRRWRSTLQIRTKNYWRSVWIWGCSSESPSPF